MSEEKKDLPDNDKPRRATGFYWVRFNDGDWVVAHWFYTHWFLPGYSKERDDSSFMEINENRIIRL